MKNNGTRGIKRHQRGYTIESSSIPGTQERGQRTVHDGVEMVKEWDMRDLMKCCCLEVQQSQENRLTKKVPTTTLLPLFLQSTLWVSAETPLSQFFSNLSQNPLSSRKACKLYKVEVLTLDANSSKSTKQKSWRQK